MAGVHDSGGPDWIEHACGDNCTWKPPKPPSNETAKPFKFDMQCWGCSMLRRYENDGEWCVDCGNAYCDICFYTDRHTCYAISDDEYYAVEAKYMGYEPKHFQIRNVAVKTSKIIEMLQFKMPGFDRSWDDAEYETKAGIIKAVEDILTEPELP